MYTVTLLSNICCKLLSSLDYDERMRASNLDDAQNQGSLSRSLDPQGFMYSDRYFYTCYTIFRFLQSNQRTQVDHGYKCSAARVPSGSFNLLDVFLAKHVKRRSKPKLSVTQSCTAKNDLKKQTGKLRISRFSVA